MKPQTKREYLKQLVSEKNKWFRPLSDEEKALGFLGWHERGYLPHCDYPGLVQFVTFRLEDSMPASRRGEWEHFLKIEDVRERRMKLEEYLDRGVGGCVLRQLSVAQSVEDTLLHGHGSVYELLSWCVMPNHVHTLVHVWKTPLWKMVQRWKIHARLEARRTSEMERQAPARPESENNNVPSRRSALQWQREYWDTFMRNEEQEGKAIRYIENNPVKARLCRVPEDCTFSSARFQDEYRRLRIPKKGVHVGL